MQIENIRRDIVLLTNKTKTKCTKMTDEGDLIKNGINGASSSVTTSDRVNINSEKVFNSEIGNASSIRKKCGSGSIHIEQDDNQATQNVAWTPSTTSESSSAVTNLDVHSSQQGIGGRLQFFKDGKFILELARTREGEKEGWVSVPRKTFWPLSSSTIIYPKNESSASLSFSDDNSSIQSSPWQRDHCWKQASPRRNISKEMCMIFKRTKHFALSHTGYKISQIKRRRPYDSTMCKMPFILANGLKHLKCEDVIDSSEKKLSEIKEKHQKVNGENKKPKIRAKLTTIIQKLIDKLPSGLFYLSKTAIIGGAVHHFSCTPSRIAELHHPQQHVSPRKRILRELEKVSLEDSNNKRSRAKSSTSTYSPVVSTTPAVTVAQSSSQVQQNVNTLNNSRSGQIINGNSTEANAPTSNRLYSSYSIHSLLGNVNNCNNHKDNSISQCSKEISDPSYLRIMLATSKSSDTNNLTGKTITTYPNHAKKSPTYSSFHDTHGHRQSPHNETEYNSLNRFKSVGNSIISTTTPFHPYLSSPKYSSSSNTSNDSFKIKTGRTSASPNHHTSVAVSRRSSPQSAFTQSPQPRYNNNQTSPTSNRMKESSKSDNISPKLDRREGTPRTVPKKTAALRQQFSAPSSSPSISQAESPAYNISNEQKRNAEDRAISPEQQLYHQAIEVDHSIGGVLRSSAIPHSALYYMYPRHGSPSTHTSPPSYIPPVSYYHPYAAAVAALRNPLWMHYQAGVPPASGPPSRLGPTMFPYNGASPGPPPLPSPLASMHLSTGSMNPWTSSSQQTLLTEDPVSLATKKDEQSSDTPLNLSKH